MFGGTNDTVFTNASSLEFIGGAGQTTIEGGTGHNTIFGAAGETIS